ncbi:discoidin domain-containing protein [Paenibacillus sp. J5C_2022]|uniref:discoidin domain-containing protein n=1 Tax=Paenibacillus sp. J5C2022 TaxID=2977129 RepID=UPI0021D3D5E1|nr:discoidin domain-containing protein [Paenibacillus sp. J5C2022]MCU6712013.1 discoidin domain-containing protein [Paenibacillus sp. J5C2022]
MMGGNKTILMVLALLLIFGLFPVSGLIAEAEQSTDSVNIAGSAELQVDSVTEGNTANLAVDGSTSSRWVSGDTSYEHTFEMTWGNPQSFHEVKVWSGNVGTGNHNWHIRDYTLDYWNGADWITIASVVDNDKDNNLGHYNHFVFETVTASKLRLHITKPSWGGSYGPEDKIARLAEIEVFSDFSSGLNNFVTRSGDKLMDGLSEFRFISINSSNLTYIPAPEWHRADPWEQEDVFKSLQQMGATATRLYTFTIKGSIAYGSEKRHINGWRDYDEDYFMDLDYVLKLANQYGIRVIIPFIDTWDHVGGVKHFAALRGKTQDEFYTDPELKEDYKHLVNYVLNRTNTYTGVKYKDDKAILAWETGNELYSPDDWTSEMAAYIKSVDSNHLVMDGHYGIAAASLDDPNIDIVSNHYYEGGGADYALRAEADRALSKGKKALIIGEFGGSSTSNFTNLFNEVIQNGTSGAMLWTLKFHNKDGGFYNGDYRWPGFPSGEAYDETAVMQLIREKAYEIRGLSVPPREVPDAPSLLPIESVLGIWWRGSVGAETYRIERATDPNGPWAVVGDNVLDSDIPFVPYQDSDFIEGEMYYYRIKAVNIAGISEPSNMVGPVMASSVLPVPIAPVLYPFQSVSAITWGKVTWAESYDVERATDPSGPWTVVGSNVLASEIPFKDASANSGMPYYYQVKAKNASGTSEPSGMFGPIIVNNVAQLAQLTVDSTDGTHVKENAVDGRLHTRWLSQDTEMNHFFQLDWAVPQTINRVKIWSGNVGGSNWHIRDFTIEYLDGLEWKVLASVTDNEKDGFYGQHNDITFTPIQTTAMRMNITKPSWGGSSAHTNDKIARLIEFEASYSSDPPPNEAFAGLDGPGSVNANETFTMQYDLSNMVNVSAQDVTITYNPELFVYQNAVPANARTVIQSVYHEPAAATVRYILVHPGEDSMMNGGAPMLDIAFTAAAGEAEFGEIEITKAILADGSGGTQPANLTNAKLSVQINADKSALLASIAAAQAVADTAVVGIQDGQYPDYAYSVLLAAIASATVQADDPSATLSQIMLAKENLDDAVELFQGYVITSDTGNLNGDGVIDIGDVGIAAVHYGKREGDAGWKPEYDLDGDGMIGMYELSFIVNRMLEP